MSTVVIVIVAVPSPVSAHGIGGRQDLPVPLEYFLVGAGLVLILSFAALAVLWPQPRWQVPSNGRPLAGRWLDVVKPIAGLFGLSGLVLVVSSGLAGIDNPARNPAPALVFVGFWLVIPFLSALVGNVYPLFDPWSRLARLFRLGDDSDTHQQKRLGYLPATGVFLAFTWLELVAPDSGPATLAVAALFYTGYLLAGSAWLGRDTVTKSLDGFAAYNRLFGAIGPIDLYGERPRWRGWLRGLPHLPERPGLTLMVVTMIGTVTYDGASATVWWESAVATPITTPIIETGWSVVAANTVAGTVGLVAVTTLVGLAYLTASIVAARIAGGSTRGRTVARRFAHTLVPIAFAYAFAHYFSLIVFEGQYLLSTISDPFGTGWNLFGTADRAIDYTLISPTGVWWTQVAVIVGGHVAGVVLAHDRALADFPTTTAVRSQYAMLALMVLLTGLGLTILAAG